MDDKLKVCERDYWVYQKRSDTMFPWAVRMTKRSEKGKRRTKYVEFDFAVYMESIPSRTRSRYFTNVHRETPKGYVDFLVRVLRSYTDVTEEDTEQLYNAVLDAMID